MAVRKGKMRKTQDVTVAALYLGSNVGPEVATEFMKLVRRAAAARTLLRNGERSPFAVVIAEALNEYLAEANRKLKLAGGVSV